MNTDKFDFQEALAYIKADMPVQLTLNGVIRKYYLNDKGEMMCTPKEKDFLTYKVKQFHIDAVMSNDWELCE